MRKITSFLMMTVLCCISAIAQDVVGTELPENMLIKIGTAQAEMEPGKWYILHNPRNPNTSATDFAPVGEYPASAGGFVTDMGLGQHVKLTATSVIDELTSEEGVSSNNYLANMVRFVAVDGVEGAFNIQFGTGNWLADSPANGTVNNNNYLAGNAGQYNFYLVTVEGEPNTAGRFGWNKYNMANRVDNNGAGGTVVFWSEGETTAENLDTNIADEGHEGIKGNKIWQIYEIEIVGDLDLYEDAFMALMEDYDFVSAQSEGNFIQSLIDGENVGNSYGNYRTEDVEAFLAIHAKVESVVEMYEDDPDALMELYPTAEDLKALNEEYVKVYNHMLENKIPTSMTDIKPGYYTINSVLFWYTTKNDTTYYTQVEADSVNAESGIEPGEEGYIVADSTIKEVKSSQVAAPIKSLRSKQGTTNTGATVDALAWGTQEPTAEFLWKIESVEGKPTEYRLINMWKGYTFTGINQSANAFMEANDTATVCFDWRNNAEPVKHMIDTVEVNDTVVSFNIRSSSQNENGYNYLHCGGHSAGAGTGSWIVGWSDGGATRWYLAPVEEATANAWIEAASEPKKLQSMFTKADSIIAAFPSQLEIAKDIETTIHENDSVVVTADQFYSQYTTEDAQTIPDGQTVYDFMLDGKQSTYWHSAWEAGSVGQKVHYLQVNATEALEGLYAVKLQRRPVSGDHITELIVKGYVDAPTDETTFEEGTELGTLKLPLTANNETIVTNTFDATGMNYLRFYSTTTAAAASGGGSNRGYWHASAFNVFKATASPRYETTQYDVRKELADALTAAIAAWEAAEFDEDSVSTTDETFVATYNALVNAYEAWAAVYTDPTELRDVIAASPAENLFVFGNNPGQWKEGTVTPAALVKAAEAYNATGKYTPAESEAHIKAITEAEAKIFAEANPVETGKWYRIKFPTAADYEKYEWDTTGAEAVENETAAEQVSPALFGKVVAAGAGKTEYVGFYNDENEADTIAVYTVETAEKFYEGNNLYFFDSEKVEFSKGEDLFQFIAANDSTYMIQNKATGLYVRAGYPATLSAIPSYYYTKAIGAGASIIRAYNIFGGEDAGYNYLHAQRSNNVLTTWDSENLGSNSMLMIEEVEAATEAPANEYTVKAWPGKVETYTMPVDVTIKSGAKAYGAELVIAEDTAVVLKAIEAETITAGTAFILIADSEGDYVTAADKKKEIVAEIVAENGSYGYNDKIEADKRLSDAYAEVVLEHGVKVDTVGKNLLGLVAVMKAETVEAGKGIIAKENGFAHTLVNANVAAYSAYIAADFDAESEDVLGTIAIKIEGSIESGIQNALNKVSQGGNIYNAAGQLVGKGNINAVNNMPAGIYVVNGVKVIKK